VLAFCVADDGRGIVRKHARNRRKIADIAIDDAEQRDDGGLVGGDAVEIAHAITLAYGAAVQFPRSGKKDRATSAC
jgi:hypothetical protein